MKLIPLLLITFLSTPLLYGQSFAVPENYTVVDTVSGDLDTDGIAELVVAYNTEKETEDNYSVPRELIIYKKENNTWLVWKRSMQALYSSHDGGMMGDPFESIEIKKGILLVSQNGGSSWKWGHTDKYRYQDDAFYLIGYISNYGKLCEYWETVDFNLATGKMIVEKEYESCENDDDQKIYKRENETVTEKGIKITFENRSEKELTLVTPKYKHNIYITPGSD